MYSLIEDALLINEFESPKKSANQDQKENGGNDTERIGCQDEVEATLVYRYRLNYIQSFEFPKGNFVKKS